MDEFASKESFPSLLLAFAAYGCSEQPFFPPTATPAPLQYLLEPTNKVVQARRGASVTLPCILWVVPQNYKIRWSKVEPTEYMEVAILISNGVHHKTYGPLGSRAHLKRSHRYDASLTISNLTLDDEGRYRCQLVNGLEDESVSLVLQLEGRRGSQARQRVPHPQLCLIHPGKQMGGASCLSAEATIGGGRPLCHVSVPWAGRPSVAQPSLPPLKDGTVERETVTLLCGREEGF